MVNDWCWNLRLSFVYLSKFCLYLAVSFSFLDVLLIDSLMSLLVTLVSSARNGFLWTLSWALSVWYFFCLTNLATFMGNTLLVTLYDVIVCGENIQKSINSWFLISSSRINKISPWRNSSIKPRCFPTENDVLAVSFQRLFGGVCWRWNIGVVFIMPL